MTFKEQLDKTKPSISKVNKKKIKEHHRKGYKFCSFACDELTKFERKWLRFEGFTVIEHESYSGGYYYGVNWDF